MQAHDSTCSFVFYVFVLHVSFFAFFLFSHFKSNFPFSIVFLVAGHGFWWSPLALVFRLCSSGLHGGFREETCDCEL